MLVPDAGVEPARPKARDFKSLMYYQFHQSGKNKVGAEGQIRTDGFHVTKVVTWPLAYFSICFAMGRMIRESFTSINGK